MANEPRPHNFTVGQLKELIRDVPDATVVIAVVPPSLYVDSRLTLRYNVRIEYAGGPVLRVLPVDGGPEQPVPRPDQ